MPEPATGVEVFTSIGYTHARFSSGSVSNGIDVEGNKIPNTPDYTVSAGAQYTRVFGPATITGRADAVFYGSFKYTDDERRSARTSSRWSISGWAPLAGS